MWLQWDKAVPGTVLYTPLKHFTAFELQFPRTRANSIWKDYWKRKTFGVEFDKYKSWEIFAFAHDDSINQLKASIEK